MIQHQFVTTPHAEPIATPAKGLRRLLFFASVIALDTYCVALMLDILQANGMSRLEVASLILFAITFSWISIAFCTSVVGFLIRCFNLDPLSLKRLKPSNELPHEILNSRTALVMPVYNEGPDQVSASIEAMYYDLQKSGDAGRFDFFLLSDSNDAAVVELEQQVVDRLRTSLNGRSGFYYRRRTYNHGRKAGNISDFCTRWGGHYDFMVILDADSRMTGDVLRRLASAMEANPGAGIIQTIPVPVSQQTGFARALQFAAALYSRMLACGLSFWQTDTANYWGHNAIIRVQAFTSCCGLPVLPGKPPLGGEVLSHDFVEAALIRRGGWHVFLLPGLEGSYEQLPANLLDYAKRDRRWAEGNLQHLRLLPARGLHWLNRLYFVMGALAYGSSFLWLLMLLVGTADALIRALVPHQYFTTAYQLFPEWPVAKTQEMVLLLAIVAGILILPKLMGLLLGICNGFQRRSFGGALRMTSSMLLEFIFSVVAAPIMMTFHAYFVATILCGQRVNWEPQSRDSGRVTWSDALRATLLPSLIALVWGGATWVITPLFFLALTPVLIGLILAAPLVTLSGHKALGRWLFRRGLFLTPAETQPPAVLRNPDARARIIYAAHRFQASPQRLLPEELPLAMPSQSL